MLQDFHAVVAPGGTVILSGILAAEVRELGRGLTKHGWRMMRKVTQDEWAAVVCAEA